MHKVLHNSLISFSALWTSCIGLGTGQPFALATNDAYAVSRPSAFDAISSNCAWCLRQVKKPAQKTLTNRVQNTCSILLTKLDSVHEKLLPLVTRQHGARWLVRLAVSRSASVPSSLVHTLFAITACAY